MNDKKVVLSTNQGILAQYLMHWHKLSVDAALFLGTGAVTITGIAISRDNVSMKIVFPCVFVLLTLSMVGFFLRRIINAQIILLRSVIQKIDEENGVFSDDFLSNGGSLYPASWRQSEAANWNDPIFKFTLFAMVGLPIFMSVVVVAVAFL
jgi:hypothetical protein